MQTKSDKDLLFMVQNPKYFQRLAIEAALEELKTRNLNEVDSHLVIQTEKMFNEFPEANSHNLRPAKLVWFWFPWKHLSDLLNYYVLVFLILLLFSFPFFSGWFFWIIFILSPIVPIWQSNLISFNKTRRYNHIQSRLFFSFMLVLILVTRNYFVDDGRIDIGASILLFIAFFIFSGVVSVLVYNLNLELFRNKKYYFLPKLHHIKWLTPILLLPLIILEEGWFNSNNGKTVQWDSNNPITFKDFNGYPDLFTHFDAAIDSRIEYKFKYSNTNQIAYLGAVCHTYNTWVNPWSKNSYFLQDHERYHFNITEMVARMARKAVYEAQQYKADREEIKSILREHIRKLNKIQAAYDTETNHSLIQNMQSKWQYHIDSMLATLEPYWTSDILNEPEVYANNNVRFYRDLDIPSSIEILGINKLMPAEENYVDCYKITYANKENDIARIDHYFQGKKTNDAWSNTSTVLITRPSANETIWMFLDADGQPMLSKHGYYYKRIIKKENNLFEISYYDINSKRCVNTYGVFKTLLKTDSLNNQLEKRYYDRTGNQTVTKDGYYTLRYSYASEEGSRVERIRNYDSKMNPLADNDRAFERTYYYDSQNNYSGVSRKDIKLRPLYSDGYNRIKYIYDKLGNTIKTMYLDEYGNLVENSEGIAFFTYSSDRYGNENRISYYNANSVLTLNKNGFASTYKQYDSQNNLLSISNYDTGDIIIFDDGGYGKTEYTYDSLNRNNSVINYNGYYYPVAAFQAAPIQQYSFDSLNRIIVNRYYDENKKPYVTESGEAYCTYAYDTQNNLTEVRCFNQDDQPIAGQFDVSIYRYTYDDHGNKIETRYYTVDDKPAGGNQGASVNLYSYTPDGQMTERSYYDTLGNLTEFDGSAIIRWTYDNKGREKEISYYNKFDQPLDSGLFRVTKTYSDRNKLLEEYQYYNYPGEESRPTLVKFIYDANQRVIDKYNYFSNGLPCIDDRNIHHYRFVYDENLLIKESCFDTSENLVKRNDGISEIRYEYNNRGNKISETYYDEIGQIIVDNTGVATQINIYDKYDRIILQKFYDEYDILTLKNNLYSIVNYKRNRSGKIIEKSFYNTQGEIVVNEDSVALYVTDYDMNGDRLETTSLSLAQAKLDHDEISLDFISELGGRNQDN